MPSRLFLNLPQDVRAQVGFDQSGQAIFLILDRLTAFPESPDQAVQFFAGRKAQEDGPGYLVQFLNHAIPIQPSASLGSRIVARG